MEGDERIYSSSSPSRLDPTRRDALGFRDKKMSTKTRTAFPQKNAARRNDHSVRRVCTRVTAAAPVGGARSAAYGQTCGGSGGALKTLLARRALVYVGFGEVAWGWRRAGRWLVERAVFTGGGERACRPRPREFLLSVSLALSPLTVRHSVSIIFLFFFAAADEILRGAWRNGSGATGRRPLLVSSPHAAPLGPHFPSVRQLAADARGVPFIVYRISIFLFFFRPHRSFYGLGHVVSGACRSCFVIFCFVSLDLKSNQRPWKAEWEREWQGGGVERKKGGRPLL